MHKLQAQFHDLSRSASPGRFPISGADVVITQLAPQAILRLQGDWAVGELAAHAPKVLALNWPRPGQYEQADGKLLSWVGPKEWMLLCDLTQEAHMLKELEALLPEQFATVVPMSDSRVGFQVTGRMANDLVEKGCALDLRSPALAGQAASMTRFAGITATLLRVPNGWQLYCDVSYRAYILSWLIDANSE